MELNDSAEPFPDGFETVPPLLVEALLVVAKKPASATCGPAVVGADVSKVQFARTAAWLEPAAKAEKAARASSVDLIFILFVI